ncbi:MAG: type I restriction enzyme HsdR N-terminal domain-containing protein [Nostoc sp. DedVER02]|uniref:type I restriction enzyme HsdR N-terminal domain-containing protein n=1 Tax=unclassified Nostoc TaxID=2593658 RepID=UPI002AD54FFA|nr:MULTISPECIES: type I restriction enzyme HsdR N-terminal domain-containing protein [unclassified Nostoc]MDZ7990335.1 type I restriction enzyme HsdR N-terminal domain-containing protein [Nostoc sp. DedVER02]MDZ8115973.1 type I restriction enzyme HsdR N-terminal domain-containing protein [Nostoc sp. DedVER01b]
MIIPEPIKKFIRWIQGFDHHLLQNEADVKEKLILPMFHHLCYPEKCYREYPLKTSKLGKYGKTSEIAQIYYATDELEQQNTDTSLVFIELREPQKNKLDDPADQAKFYSEYFNTLFFIITNGYEIKVFQRSCCDQKLIFDINIDVLKNHDIALNFYNKLNFNFVKKLDKNTVSVLTANKYNLIERFLRQYPKLQDVLEKCDFEPYSTKEGYRLVVVKKKVAIACNLPKAFGEGSCEIEFSSLILKGLKIYLNHQDILGQLMTGLHTQPNWGCRRFFKQLDRNNFEVYLGQTTLILSDKETAELCLCIDGVCQEYKNLIIEFENSLETWNFEFVNFSGSRGFILFSVRQELWNLMQQFANEFDYTKGKSEWHLFHRNNMSIRVSGGIRDHTFIFSKIDINSSLLPNNQINIIYELNDVNLQSIDREKFTSWQQDIGVRGTWTARYTKQWLLEKYIPKVINYYSQESQISEAEWLAKITNYTSDRVLISEIDNIKDFAPYLRDIQSWLHIYIENIAASLLKVYYQAYTNLVRNTDSSITGIDYIVGNLRRIEWKNTPEGMSNITDWKNLTFKHAIDCLDKQVARINNCEYENSLNADLITRTFIWIIENGKISFSQAQLNAAKQAVLPLWEQSRFEMRHVYPNR